MQALQPRRFSVYGRQALHRACACSRIDTGPFINHIPFAMSAEANASSAPSRRRILSLEGGGVRGVFALGILQRTEDLLREHTGNPQLVLADHFDLIAGTSTGAIIGTLLSWGISVERIRRLYDERAREMFRPSPLREVARGRYSAGGLTEFLQGVFAEPDGRPALLGSERLRTLLLVVLRNATTGSAWPLSNNPRAKFNQDPLLADGSLNPDCNLNLPLWQVVRGSTAAPWFFPPETIRVGQGQSFQFLDGGLTPYNNPAFIALLSATLPAYRIEWTATPEQLLLVSVGCGRTRTGANSQLRFLPPLLRHLRAVPAAWTEGPMFQQDMLCRVFGHCLHGEVLDMELGDLIDDPQAQAAGMVRSEDKRCSYVSYNRLFPADEVRQIEKTHRCRFGMDQLKLMPALAEAGAAYARDHVKLEHLL